MPKTPPPPLDTLLANALAATHYAVAAAFLTHARHHHIPTQLPSCPDDFDWPQLEALIHRLGYEADESDAALNLYRLLTAVQRIAYREGAGRNANWHSARLNPRPSHGT
ncbi:hypothetical protein ACIGZJ_29460 [Kitasatospora sp. NPDC052868]|uniref:hypothetical protein n=1 Tax=Kitasatospora sp. NPDC052868 TaxID=3364060 RepID=UPI0037C66F27